MFGVLESQRSIGWKARCDDCQDRMHTRSCSSDAIVTVDRQILHEPLRYTCATVGNRAPHPRISMSPARMDDAGFRSFTHTHALSKHCKDSNVKIQGLEGMTCVTTVWRHGRLSETLVRLWSLVTADESQLPVREDHV